MATQATTPTLPSPTLYDLTIAGLEMNALLESLDGELTPELEQQLDALLLAGADKLESAAKVVQRLTAQAESIKATAKVVEAEATRLYDRSESVLANAERLKKRMVYALDAVHGGKLKTPLFTIWAQTSATTIAIEPAEGFTPAMIAEDAPDFVVTEIKLDKAKLKAMYKQGDALPESIAVTENPGTRYCRIK